MKVESRGPITCHFYYPWRRIKGMRELTGWTTRRETTVRSGRIFAGIHFHARQNGLRRERNRIRARSCRTIIDINARAVPRILRMIEIARSTRKIDWRNNFDAQTRLRRSMLKFVLFGSNNVHADEWFLRPIIRNTYYLSSVHLLLRNVR